MNFSFCTETFLPPMSLEVYLGTFMEKVPNKHGFNSGVANGALEQEQEEEF